jgi:hypothetical protein
MICIYMHRKGGESSVCCKSLLCMCVCVCIYVYVCMYVCVCVVASMCECEIPVNRAGVLWPFWNGERF